MDKRQLAFDGFWDAIVITLSVPEWRDPIEKECLKLKKAGLLPNHDHFLVVDDPQFTSSQSLGVGDGGATLNGLLIIVERLSSLAGHTMVNGDVLHKNRILIVHGGKNSRQMIGGNLLLPLSSSTSWIPPSCQTPFPATILQNSIWMATVLASKSGPGVWIGSLDYFVPFCNLIDIPDTKSIDGAIVCSLEAEAELLTTAEHNIIYADPQGKVKKIVYDNPCRLLERNSKILAVSNIISGYIFLSSNVAEKYVSLYASSPIDRCTYYGTDSDTEPLQLSLYYDLLLPLCEDIEKEKYLSGELGHLYSLRADFNDSKMQESKTARLHIWNSLRKYRAFEHQLRVATFHHLDTNLSYEVSLKPLIDNLKKDDNRYFNDSSVSCKSIISCSSENVFFVNCVIGSDVRLLTQGEVIISNFNLEQSTEVLNLGNHLIWQTWPMSTDDNIVTCHGFDDVVSLDVNHEDATVFNVSWKDFMQLTKLNFEDLWEKDSTSRCLLTAKLFPSGITVEDQFRILQMLIDVSSMRNKKNSTELLQFKSVSRKSFYELSRMYDMDLLLQNEAKILFRITENYINETAKQFTGLSWLPLIKNTSISLEASLRLLSQLHEMLLDSGVHASRLFANVANLLGCMAGSKGGLRSGPSSNRAWLPALQALKEGELAQGTKMLMATCKMYIETGRPEYIIRASRHYERASHIMISKQVETANEQVFPLFEPLSACFPMGVWVEASSPARLDLAGGWSDTPPICYEQGGAVLNVAIKVNGRNPIGAKACIIPSLEIICILRDRFGSETKLIWTQLDHLKDYTNPVAPAALVKAALIYSHFIDLSSEECLADQLQNRYKGGLEIILWSELPQGSGLGGSSIIAGTVLGAIFVLMGHTKTTIDQLIHATLGIEQMHTTGGGWQDQVGGLVGGVKLGVSDRGVPLVVRTYCLPLTSNFVDFLDKRLMLVYTGKIRLARYLVQTVLRNWYAREDFLLRCFSDVRNLALTAAEAVFNENGTSLGRCIDDYWNLKRSIASGCEPRKVGELLKKLSTDTLGSCMAGSGGGGYLYAVFRDPLSTDVDAKLTKVLANDFSEMLRDAVEIDRDGLVVSVNDRVVVSGADRRQTQLTREILQTLIE